MMAIDAFLMMIFDAFCFLDFFFKSTYVFLLSDRHMDLEFSKNSSRKCQQTNRGPFVKGKIFDIVIMSNILPFKNGPEESFVKGKIFYIVLR